MERYIEVNGVTLCIDDTMVTDKKALLLYHGLTGSKEAMYEIRDIMQDRYRVICVDTRGHGKSTHPAEYTLEDHAKDVHELIRVLELGKVDIIGHSMGSYVALAAAEMCCEDIDHLVLYSTKPSGKTSSVERILKERGLDIRTLSEEQMIQIIMTFTFAPDSLARIQKGELLLPDPSQMPVLSPEEKAIESKSIAGFDNSLGYDKVTCKTLVISGEFDGINSWQEGKEVADGIKGAQFVLIKDAAHMSAMEQPGQFFTAVDEFFNS